MSLPDPVTRKEMYLNKAATGSGSVPPEPVTREEMYLAEIANGGGAGGATSLAQLSDVEIRSPEVRQTLVNLAASSGTGRKWRNSFLRLNDLSNIDFSNAGADYVLMSEAGGGQFYFEKLACFETYAMDDASASSLTQVLTMLKSSAKSSGKSGVKISYPLASTMLSYLNNIHDNKKKMPMFAIGQYAFNLKSRFSTTMMAFAGTDIDADGVYDISFVLDGSAGVGYVTVEYTACPAMS